MTIETPKPKPPPFIKRAEEFLEKKRLAWVAHWKGTPAEPQALEFCRREGWLLPDVEGLESVTALNLFPNCSCTDLKELERRVKAGELTEAEATKIVAGNAISDMGEAEAGINRLRYPGTQSILQRQPRPMAAVLAKVAPPIPAVDKEEAKDSTTVAPYVALTQNPEYLRMAAPPPVDPSRPFKGLAAAVAVAALPAQAPPAAPSAVPGGVLRGTPEALTTTSRREHGVCFGGVYAYTFDVQLAETLKAGQVQGVHFEATTEQGEFGLRLVALRMISPNTP